ncbi:Liprin-beta-1 isoform X7 [Oopsacas minuta]|uniref:Liprin-beta-1 isoform X7 n=1 Tax=Oopsacas minuta TaxID=111878 RepID=A0AAV7JWQ7_9METZ|nr:Liprin-beta-1 isoform X7 [Oopsacas minuta]
MTDSPSEERLYNGLASDNSDTSLNSLDGIDSVENIEDFVTLDNIELAISQVSQLLAFERNRNGLVLPPEIQEFEDSLIINDLPEVYERGDQIRSLCQELSVLLSDNEHESSSDTNIPEDTARMLVQWLLKFIPEDKQCELITGTPLSPLSTPRTHLSASGHISQTTSETGLIPVSNKRESTLSTSVPHIPQTDSDYPSTTTSASAINEYTPQARTKSLPSSSYLSTTLPRYSRDRASTTPAGNTTPGYLSDLEDSNHYKHSIPISREAFMRVESMGLLSHESTRDFHTDDRQHRHKACTPEPWLSLEDQPPIFKRRGSLRKFTKAIGTKLKKGQQGEKVVILGSTPPLLVMDQTHRREFLSKDIIALQEWFVALGLEEYCQKILNERINSCTLLKLVIDGKLEKVLSLSHPLHKKKLELALEETLKYGTTVLTDLNYKWVLNWLEMNGLTEICPIFEQARVDGRMLYMLTFDDLLLLKVEEPFYQLSLKSAIKALRLTSFSPNYLDSRELQDNCLYWSCPHVGEWIALTLRMRGMDEFKRSGINGAFMMLEDSFTGSTLAEILNIPKSKAHLRSVVKEEFMKVIGPHCAQHKLDKSKTKNFVHISPPSHKVKKKGSTRLGAKATERRSSRDGTRLLCPLIFEPNSNSPCFQGNLSVFQGLIDTYIYSATDLDTPKLDRSEIESLVNSSQLSRVVTDEDGDILV